jgi:phage tail sheath protein FI
VPTSIAAFVGATARGPRNKPVRIQSSAEYERTFGGLRPRRPLSYAVRHFFDNGGRQAWVVRVGRHARPTGAEISGSASAKTGIRALERVDIFNLLVLPDPAASVAVLARALAYCGRRRALLLLDVPESAATPAQVAAWIASSASPLKSRDAAAYFPRFLAADPLSGGTLRAFPASGAVAGVYARIDEKRGVWKAPAGVEATIVGAAGLAIPLTDGSIETLNALGINCLRARPGQPLVAWGARTMEASGSGSGGGTDDWKYVNVRRLALYIEESISRGIQWAVFEPNAEPTWANVRVDVGNFLHGLFLQGALQGATPNEAFFVKCGTDTMSQDDITRGAMNVVVGFAALRPAEFVMITLRQLSGRRCPP